MGTLVRAMVKGLCGAPRAPRRAERAQAVLVGHRAKGKGAGLRAVLKRQ